MKNSFVKGIFSLAKEEPIDFKTQKIISHSQVSMYNKCPKSWELRYVRKHKKVEGSMYLVFGQAMHTVIQEWLTIMYTKTVKAANELDTSSRLSEELKQEYKAAVEKLEGVHFSSPEELSTFFRNGVEILKYLKNKRAIFFSTKHLDLVAVELPIHVVPDPNKPNVILQGYLDLVFYDKTMNKYLIIDIKTSKKGWRPEYEKKDKSKISQLILYKKYFCEIYDLPLDNVDIQYFILKQQIDLDSLWPQKRIQTFSPPSGKVTINRLMKEFMEFISDCFDDDGNYIEKNHPAFAGKNYFNCRFCPHNESEDLCPKSNRITNI